MLDIFGKKHRTSVSLFLITAFVYILAPYTIAGDMLPNMLLPISIIREGNLTFNEFYPEGTAVPWPFTVHNENIVSGYPIVPGLLNVPVYFITNLLGTADMMADIYELSMLTSAIIAALSVVFMYQCLQLLCKSKNEALFFAFVYAFATAVWGSVSRGLWQHGPSLLFFNAAFWLLLRKKPKGIAFSGFLLGMAVWTRPTNILIALPVAIYVLVHHKKQAVELTLWALIPAAFMGTYSLSHYGSLMAVGQGLHSFDKFSGSMLVGFFGLLISPSRGILVYTPIFLFSFWYAVMLAIGKKRDEEPLLFYLALAIIPYLLIYAKWHMWWGGYVFGYRIISEMIPLCIFFLVRAWQQHIRHRPVWIAAFTVLLSFSFFVQFLDIASLNCSSGKESADLNESQEALWRISDSQIVRCTKNLLAGENLFEK